jgi:hypothetical protein
VKLLQVAPNFQSPFFGVGGSTPFQAFSTCSQVAADSALRMPGTIWLRNDFHTNKRFAVSAKRTIFSEGIMNKV